MIALHSQADAANREGNTPLHYACQYCPSGKTLTIVKLLQWSERSILLPNKAGETPFSLAIRFNKKGMTSEEVLLALHDLSLEVVPTGSVKVQVLTYRCKKC